MCKCVVSFFSFCDIPLLDTHCAAFPNSIERRGIFSLLSPNVDMGTKRMDLKEREEFGCLCDTFRSSYFSYIQ